MQLSLIDPEPFDSAPGGQEHYVPVLQNKSGELEALLHATSDTWDHITPLIQFVGPKNQQDPLTAASVGSWVKKLSDVVGSHPIFVDVARLKPNRATTGKGPDQPVLTCIMDNLRKRGARAIPVLNLTFAKECAPMVRDASLVDGRGLAIRYPVMGGVNLNSTPAKRIEDALGLAEAKMGDVDLLLDMGYLPPGSVIEAADLEEFVDTLPDFAEFRNVVLLGTSMPSSLGIVSEGTVGFLERAEWRIWSALRASQPSNKVIYGDYGVQNPLPPLDRGGPGMRANVRYTSTEVTLISRGVGQLIQEGAEQYRELCRRIVDRDEFAGEEFSWGDRVISECADGTGPVGWQSLWRGAGASHHLRHVVHQLSA